MKIIAAALAVAACGSPVPSARVALPGQEEPPPFLCVLTVAARTQPVAIMDAADSAGGMTCGRRSPRDPVVIVVPASMGDCGAVDLGLATSDRRSMSGAHGQEFARRCSPILSGTRDGYVTALVRRGVGARKYSEIASELTTYAGWSGVPARYFIDSAVGGVAVFCFESDSEADVVSYLADAGFEGLSRFKIVRGAGACREVVREQVGIDLSWRDGD